VKLCLVQNKIITIRTFVLALLIMITAWAAPVTLVSARDLTAPTQVVNEYLNSLVNGDTQKLVQLIDGPMKQNNRQLVLSPASYSQYLKTNYAGVQATIEDVTPDGAGVHARVRFDYPSGDSSVIEFLLTENNGLWKITDELY
jgi:predicted ester cyclase